MTENRFYSVPTDSPVTTLLLKNYLFKIMDYFETDYAVFLWKNEITPYSGGMAVGSLWRISAEELDMLRGMYWLHFDIARGKPSIDEGAPLIKEFYCMDRHQGYENPHAGYLCLDLFRHEYVTSMAGAGYLAERPQSRRFVSEYKPEQFLVHSAVAVMRRLRPATNY